MSLLDGRNVGHAHHDPCPLCIACDYYEGDDGTDISAHPADKGGAYATTGPSANSAAIQSNSLQHVPDGVNGYFGFLDVEPAGGSVEADVTIVTASGGTYTSPGIMFLADPTTGTGFILYLHKSSSKSKSWRADFFDAWAIVGGTGGAVPDVVVGTTYNLRAEYSADATAVEVFIDDISMGTVDLSGYGAATDNEVGIGYLYRGQTETLLQWDNFEATSD